MGYCIVMIVSFVVGFVTACYGFTLTIKRGSMEANGRKYIIKDIGPA